MEEGQQDTCGDSRAYHTGHIGTHGVLEEVVGAVVLEAYVVGHTGGIGNGTDTRVTDKRVDFVAFLEEEVENLHEEDTAEGGDDKGEGTKAEDEHRTAGEERGGLGGGTDGDTDKEVQMLTMALLATSLRRLVTPHSFNRLPKKSIPNSGRPLGTMNAQKRKPTMGKEIFSSLET